LWKKPIKRPEFWITNISQRLNVSIDDLGIRLNPLQSIDLFSGRYPLITGEDIKNSAIAGSIYKKSKYIKIRVEQPPKLIPPGIYVSDKPRQYDLKNLTPNAPKKEYEELDGLDNSTDTQWAADEAEMAEADRTAGLSPKATSEKEKE